MIPKDLFWGMVALSFCFDPNLLHYHSQNVGNLSTKEFEFDPNADIPVRYVQ